MQIPRNDDLFTDGIGESDIPSLMKKVIEHGMESKHTLHPKIWIGIGAIILYLIVAIVIVYQSLFPKPTKQNELDIIQSIIENIEIYQEDMEAWGYHVSVFTPEKEAENEPLKRYYRNHCKPVLVLTDADGGLYCFYFGFDQYTSLVSRPAMVEQGEDGYEEAMKTVHLELCKSDLYQAPFSENPNEVGTRGYYDVEVEMDAEVFSLNTGEEILAHFESGNHFTYYCSNNFVEHMRFNGLDPEENSRNEDRCIKREYSAEQLLGFYQQGIMLQERLFALYDEKNAADDGGASGDVHSRPPAKPAEDRFHSALSPDQAVNPDVQLDTHNHKQIRTDEYRIDLHKTQIPTTEKNKAALAAEITQMKSDKTYDLFLEKTAEPESCLSISVYTSGGDQLQMIEEQCNVASPYYLDRIVTFDDFNCDGYADMAVIVYEGAMNVIYQLYVWSPNEEQFQKVVCDEPLYHPEVQDGMVVDMAKLGAAELERTCFMWENESTLVKASSETVVLEDRSS